MSTIAVNGEATIERPAETGTVRLRIAVEGPHREAVLNESVILHGSIVDGIIGHKSDGNISVWTADQVRVSSYKVRRNDEGEEPLIRHRASAYLTACFTNFDALASWLTRISARAGIDIDGIDWALTDATVRHVERQVRAAAVADAVHRAEDFTAPLSNTNLRLAAIFEKGLRPVNGASGFDGGRGRAGATGAPIPAFELKPRDIRVTATVTADFTF